MCGVIGYSGFDASNAIAAGMHAIAHRGPDDSGVFIDSTASVGLGHRRLAIVDLSSAGHQPMSSRNGDAILVYNGEIYNFRELKVVLEDRGAVFRGQSDTEVLLEGYLAFGEGVLPRLDGIFAFAVFDRNKNAILLARDAFGVKPLYFASWDGRFVFASELKALLHVWPGRPALNEVALHRYMSFLWCPGNETPLRGVQKLGPGEAMWVRDGVIQRHWNWRPSSWPAERMAPLELAATISGTADRLRNAVHRQLVSDVPIGAFLSGGLDSSAVVAFARERRPGINCFTIETSDTRDEGMTDDLPYARKVAEHLDVKLDVVTVRPEEMVSDLEQMVTQLDEPLADPAPLNVLYISRLARKNGIKVLLSGAGGDDVFTGYRRHRAVQLEPYWQWIPSQGKRWLSHGSRRLDKRRPFFRRIAKLLNGAELEGDRRLVNYFLWSSRDDLRALYTPAFRGAVGTHEAEEPMLDFLAGLPRTLSPVDRMLALEQRFFLADHNLLYTDKMSMAAGVEVRVPFLDRDVVEWAAAIPGALKQRRGVGKWILKKAMEPYLPRDVIHRPKSGFGAPIRRWMRRDLKVLMNDTLSTSSLERRGLFEPAAVQRLIAANASGAVDASYTLLSLVCIEIWCRHFIDTAMTA